MQVRVATPLQTLPSFRAPCLLLWKDTVRVCGPALHPLLVDFKVILFVRQGLFGSTLVGRSFRGCCTANQRPQAEPQLSRVNSRSNAPLARTNGSSSTTHRRSEQQHGCRKASGRSTRPCTAAAVAVETPSTSGSTHPKQQQQQARPLPAMPDARTHRWQHRGAFP